MPTMTFEWDDAKAESNVQKHDVTFEQAATAFGDPFFLIFLDPDHSVDEQRFILLGESADRNLLVVSYTDHEGVVRIISARKATSAERRNYEEDI